MGQAERENTPLGKSRELEPTFKKIQKILETNCEIRGGERTMTKRKYEAITQLPNLFDGVYKYFCL